MLVAQTEHARLSGVMAAAWRFAGARPHSEVIRAIAQHDDGWEEVDAAPRINGRGEPRSFMEMPHGEHYAIWARSVELVAQRGLLYGACVVGQYFVNRARHDTKLARLSPRDAVALGNFIATHERKIARWRAELANRAGDNGGEHSSFATDTATPSLLDLPVGGSFEEDVALLDVCDALSILLCTDFSGTTVIDNVPYLGSVDRLTVRRPNGKFGLEIEPLPFRKNLRDHVRAIAIPAVPCTSDDELRAAIRAGSSVSQEFLLSARAEDVTVA
jgi:hypothetical protein